MARVTFPEALVPATVESSLHDLYEASADRQQIELDLRHLREVEGSAGAMVGTALLGSLRDVPLRVMLPRNAQYLAMIDQGGLTFALAQRADLQIEGADRLVLNRWRESWRFGAVDRMTAANGVPSEPYRNAVFVNPHLSGSRAGTTTAGQLVSPWLGRANVTPADASEGREIADNVTAIFNELVDNIRVHAGIGVAATPALAMLTVRQDLHQLRLTVQDAGAGIAATAKPKVFRGLAKRGEEGSDFSEGEIIDILLQGASLPWPHGSGLGLPRVAEKCKANGGTVDVFSNRARLVNGEPQKDSDFDLQGTVVTIAMPLLASDRPAARAL